MGDHPHSSFKTRFFHFIHSPVAGGIVLLAATVIAITLSHIPGVGAWYHDIWGVHLSIGLDDFKLDKSLEHWINDGLMSIFFFVVGLEIKREIMVGELSSLKQASLPFAAALGGMVVPAVIYALYNNGTIYESGWGIPMATDIAFALGILLLMSSRVPTSLKIFLTALAVVDDLGAIIVIALFYSSSINWVMLLLAGCILIMLTIFNRKGLHAMKYYLLPSITLWILFLNSGIHATIAGVLIALTIPSDAKYNKAFFLCRAKDLVQRFSDSDKGESEVIANAEQPVLLQKLRKVSRRAISPSQRLEHALHPVVTFVIMPLFALANAGVVIASDDWATLASTQSMGIIMGLVIGKPLGITLFCWLVIKLGWGVMPKGARWRTLIPVACLAGIGFTMSIFIDNLAFTDQTMINHGKIAILVASVIAGVLGSVLLMTFSKSRPIEVEDSEI